MLIQKNIKLVITNNYTTAFGPLSRELLRVRQPDAWRSPLFQSGAWDGYTYFIGKTGKFLTGFVPMLQEILPDIKLVDNRVSPQEQFADYSIAFPYYSYQKEAIEIALKEKRGVIWAATNAGKSIIIAGLCKALSQCKIVIVTYGKSLIKQTHETIEKHIGEDVGLLDGDTKNTPNTRVTVASINTLASRKINLKEQVLIFDECHLSSAKQQYSYGKRSQAFYRFAFSGTALHGKIKDRRCGLEKYTIRDAKLIGMTGPIIYRITNQDLIDLGVSAKPTVHLHPVDAPYSNSYDESIVDGIVRNEKLNKKIRKLSIRNSGHQLILVNRIEHGETLSKLLNCRFVYGKTPTKERTFFEGEKTLIANQIFNMGLNLPINHLYLASGGRGDNNESNAIQQLQRAGRALRKKDDENIVSIHDFIFFGNPKLEAHSLERINTWEKEKFKIVVHKK